MNYSKKSLDILKGSEAIPQNQHEATMGTDQISEHMGHWEHLWEVSNRPVLCSSGKVRCGERRAFANWNHLKILHWWWRWGLWVFIADIRKEVMALMLNDLANMDPQQITHAL